MFGNTKAFSGFAVDDLQAAKKFYGETLGLETSEHYGLPTLMPLASRPPLPLRLCRFVTRRDPCGPPLTVTMSVRIARKARKARESRRHGP